MVARSDWVGQLALALAMVVVLSVLIFVGWYYVVDHTLKLGGWSVVPAILAVVAAILIARYAAGAYVENSAKYNGPIILALFILISISGMGTINAIYVTVESKTIARADMTAIEVKYQNLVAEARDQIVPQAFIDQAARLDSLLSNLKRELDNPSPGFCGFGQSARSIFTAMQAELPNLRLLNGSEPFDPCDSARATRLHTSYAEMVAEQLPNLPQYSAVNLPEGLRLIEQIQQNQVDVSDRLDAVRADINDLRILDDQSLEPIRAAAGQYNTDAAAVRSFLDDRLASDRQATEQLLVLTEPISTLNSDRATSHFGALEVLWRQLFGPDTWFKSLAYLVLAIVLDLALFHTLVGLRQRMDAVVARRPPVSVAKISRIGPTMN